jgi:1,2-diacylglycerol 3-alpha-glucosyltransferase
VPNALLLITGEGPAVHSLKQQVKSLGLQDNVQFIGYLDRYTELNACYNAADIFVFSSKSETQGLVLLEAMAQATPVVAIAELGTASILVDDLGAKIATESEVDFVEKIHALLINNEERKALGLRGKEYAYTKWTSAAQTDRMLGLYGNMILEKAELMSTENKLSVQKG